jgi:hypothetical protein
MHQTYQLTWKGDEIMGSVAMLKDKLPACHNQEGLTVGGRTVCCTRCCKISEQCGFSKYDILLNFVERGW